MNKLKAPIRVGSSAGLGVSIDTTQSRLWLPNGSSLSLGNPKLIWHEKGKAILQLCATDCGEQIFYANLVVGIVPQRVSWQIQKCLSWLKAKCGNTLNLLRWPRLSGQHDKNMVSGFHKRVDMTPNGQKLRHPVKKDEVNQ